ncbi:MFS general substrate transporter [Colletotrichum zoysiae]|uniref:MFS general substrate transporter n=1 Tax=Colletotrichum zoysiae TaxID=1216348 RepID=A0AAD9HJP8_9PEZI|nr:MFS general substrate transporter [Colletotrichum zoysiae]
MQDPKSTSSGAAGCPKYNTFISSTDVESDHTSTTAIPDGTLTSSATDGRKEETFELGREYFLSTNYIGSLAAIGLSGMAGIGAFSLIAPILTSVNESIGPDANIVWVSLASNLAQAIMLTITGRLSDMFGRRYIQTAGTALALIGCVIGATAKTVNILIGANVLVGLGSATQVSFPYLISELVPMNYRYFASTYIYTLLIPVAGLAPVVATTLAANTASGWRSCYYILIAINAIALMCWAAFYHPPSWAELAAREFGEAHDKKSTLRHIDYGGLFLLSSGLLLFLLGISWGGSLYPWTSAAVLCTIILGGVTLVGFVFYEWRCPATQPLVPLAMFRNTGWVAVLLTLSMAASMYYAFSIVFPSQVAVLYSSESEVNQGWLKCVITAPPLLGQIIAGLLATRIGKIKWQLVITATVGAAFYAGMSTACVNTHNRDTVVTLLVVGGFALGWVDALCLASLSVTLEKQSLIGTGVGIATSLRTFISTCSAAIFNTVLNNRLATTVPQLVPPAVTEAGLPAASVSEFVRLLSVDQSLLTSVPGTNSTIIEIGIEMFKVANARAYSTVFLTTIAFSGLGVIVSLMTPEIESKLHKKVTCRLQV